jgi:hypothetical protein
MSNRLDALDLHNEIYFQHDRCPVHNFGPATDFVREAFPGRVIGTREELAWPARSPDSNIVNSFLRGHTTPFPNVEALEQAITDCFENISHNTSTNVQLNFT